MGPSAQARKFVKALVTRILEFEFEFMPYRLERVSTSKLLTLVRSKLNSARRRPGAPWYPVQIMINPSAACTLRCPLCPAVTNAINEHRGVMASSTFKSLMDEVGDHAVIAILWMWGEPFVNPRLSDMIAYARSKNVATVTSTNGQHIQTKQEAEALVASGLDNLIVALDGATQETYGQYRAGGDIWKIFRCLELIQQAKDSLGSDKPGVNVRTVVMKYNEHELPEIERLARRYGADMVSRKRASALDYRTSDADESFTPETSRYRRFRYRRRPGARPPKKKFCCRRPWNRMSVAWDGTMLSCEFDFTKTAPFGHGSSEGSFLANWWGQEAAAFREQFLADMTAYPFCADCPYESRSPRECTIETVRLKRQA